MKKENSFRRTFLGFTAGVGITLIAGTNNCQTSSSKDSVNINETAIVKVERAPDEKIPGIIDQNVPIGPVYSDKEVPANMCSRYGRLAANDLFGIQYPRADAWNIRNGPKIDEIRVNSKNELESLVKNGSLKPGMLLGIYYPNSRYNDAAKMTGAGYTHIAIYLGQKNGKLYFADKFGKETRTRISIDELLNRGNLQPREVLFVSEKM